MCASMRWKTFNSTPRLSYPHFLAAAPDTNLDRPPPGAELLGACRSGRLQKATPRTLELCRPLRLERKQTGIREEQDQ